MGSSRDGIWRGFLLGVTLATGLGVVGYGATALAQEQQQQPKFKEEVEVTGTLIPRPTLEAMSPVATLEPEQIQASGITRLEDLLTSLPQIFAAQNSTIANGATGTATIDLRNMGAVRTLVLIDGKRMAPGDPFANETDINFIPSFLVKRVDILTGGASTTYGADAVAGVVNFILDRDFEGFRGGIQYNGYEHDNNNALAQRINKARGFTPPSGNIWNGSAVDAYVSYGGKFAEGHGHATGYVEYRRTSAMLKKTRDYLNCAVTGISTSGPACGGSSTNPNGRFLVYDPTNTDLVGDYAIDFSNNTAVPFGSKYLFNYGAINFAQRPDTRWTAGGFLDYVWNEHFHGYVDLMMMDDVSDAQIAPSGDFGNTALLNCDNPMLTPDEYQKFCVDAGYGPHDMANITILRRNIEGGPRSDHLEHTAWRAIAGLKGDINKAWSYDVYGLHAQVHVPESYHNDLNVDRLQNALIVDGDPNDPSTWHCRSGSADGCVPWNIFQKGGVTAAAEQYLSIPLLSSAGLRTDIVSATLNGDLTDAGVVFPSATEGIKVALGAQYRKEQMFFDDDFAYQQGLGSGQGAAPPPVHGSYYVKELYVEALVPIIQDMKGAQNLSLDLAYRYSDYSTSGRANTWKAEGQYAPISDFKFRVGVNRATRAPNIIELYRPQFIGLSGTNDPCAGASPSYTPEQCANTGVTAAQYGHILENPAHQYNSLIGGNPNLKPEVADTHYYGIVITPSGLPGFTAAFDYYDIKVKDTIGSLFFDDIVKNCAETGNSTLCGLIHRGTNGNLWFPITAGGGYISGTQNNVGARESEGVDVNASYLMPLGNSFLNFNLTATYLLHQKVNTGLYSYDCVGLMGNTCVGPLPHWRHRFQASWETGPLTVTLGWRMQGSAKVDEASNQAALSVPADIPAWKAVGSYEYSAQHYFDLSAAYHITKNVQWNVGVNNILDKEPPMGVGFSDADYGPGFYGFYDPYGRMIHSSLMFTF